MSQKKKKGLGKIFQTIGKIAPDVLDTVGSLTGVPLFNALSDAIDKDDRFDETTTQELLSLLELEIQNIQGARNSNEEIQKSQFSSWMAKNVPYVIDLIVTVIWSYMTIFLAYQFINAIINSEQPPNLTTVMALYTAVSVKFQEIIGFHRGSSAGSKIKDIFKK